MSAYADRGRVAAIFDFDGTLIEGYSASALYRHRALSGQIGVAELTRLGLSLTSFVGGGDADRSIRTAATAFAGKHIDELTALGSKVTTSALAGRVYPEAVELIRSHRRRGHLIVIASSALPFQVAGIAQALEVDVVLCTQLRHDGEGVCTGEIDGDVLWGPAKADAVRKLAEELGLDLTRCFGYANGGEDTEFLSLTGHPCAVNPNKELEVTARDRGWPVREFRSRGNSWLDYPRTIGAFSGLATSCLIGGAVGVLHRNRQVAANVALSVGGEMALSIAGVKLNVVGEHNLWSSRPAVFLTNHQSNLDGLIVFKLLRNDFTTIAKKEIGRTPGLAQFAWLINAALIDRADATRAREAMAPAIARLSDGCSIVVAPEGTRSITSRLGPFKKGPFHIALQAGVPIVPIVLRNTGELQARGSRVIRTGVVDVAVLPPIDVSRWRVDELNERIREVRSLYEQALDDWSQVAGLTGS